MEFERASEDGEYLGECPTTPLRTPLGSDTDDRRAAKEVSDRVFFNLLVILKGVILAYGATVLIALIRNGAPWASWYHFAIYTAWVATMLAATLAFVSQALLTFRVFICPTVAITLLTFCLAIAEFVSFGVLDPQPERSLRSVSEGWLLTACANAAIAFLFILAFISQVRSERYVETVADERQLSIIRGDLIGAGLATLLSLMLWWGSKIVHVPAHFLWVPALIVGLVITTALIRQHLRLRVEIPWQR